MVEQIINHILLNNSSKHKKSQFSIHMIIRLYNYFFLFKNLKKIYMTYQDLSFRVAKFDLYYLNMCFFNIFSFIKTSTTTKH